MLAAGISDELVVGLFLGFALGMVVGPLIRSWLAWREWSSASREANLRESQEARLFADMLDRMEADAWPSADESADPLDVPGAGDGTLRGRRQAPR